MPAMMPQHLGSERNDLCAVVLAAGRGRRLRPLTLLRPKPLCPVGGTPLIDHALDRVRGVTSQVAVNVHHDRAAIEAHLATSGVHISVEEGRALGTAGALGHLRPWIAGRDVLVVNADTWAPGPLVDAVTDWDRERVRVVVAGGDTLEPRSQIVATLLPWSAVAALEPVPSGLYEVVWRDRADSGVLDVASWEGPSHDCGTPARYLAANLFASGGRSVVGEGCVVEGTIERSVLWPGTVVEPSEHLVDAIRAARRVTVLVR